MGSSPLKSKPLRNPGDSIDTEIDRWLHYRLMDPFMFALAFLMVAFIEVYGYFTHMPRQPMLFSGIAIAATGYFIWRIFVVRRHVKQLRLGRDGERAVGQFLERLREDEAQIFHDIPANGFNIDHAIVSTHGIYAVETKTISKPWPKATVLVEHQCVLVAGQKPDRNPITQAASAAKWLQDFLKETTGKNFDVRGVVVFPGWYIEHRGPKGSVWVLEPKALPSFIENEPERNKLTDVRLAAFHISRYIRSEVEKAA